MQNLKFSAKGGCASGAKIKDTPINKILIKVPNWLGDAMMSIPTVKGMKRLFPQAELWVLSKSNLTGLWGFLSEVKEVISLEGGLALIKKERFDLVLILTNSFGSALRMFLTGVSRRRGYKVRARGWLLTQPVVLKNNWREMHQIEYFLGLIDGLAKADLDTTPRISIPQELQDRAKGFLTRYGWQYREPVIGIHATAAYGIAKCWLPERYSQLIQELKRIYNPWILICGSKGEEKDIEDILKWLPNHEKIINLAGKTDIVELAALIRLCKVFIVNDSGPMHLASAVDTPVVAIFGSTDPKRTGPRGRVIIIKKYIPCSPCFKRRCPKGLECMQLIEVQDVMQAVEELI